MYTIIFTILSVFFLLTWLVTSALSVKIALIMHKVRKEKDEYNRVWKYNMGISVASWLVVALIIAGVVAIIVAAAASGGTFFLALKTIFEKKVIWIAILCGTVLCNIISGGLACASVHDLNNFKNIKDIKLAWKLSLASITLNIFSVVLIAGFVIFYYSLTKIMAKRAVKGHKEYSTLDGTSGLVHSLIDEADAESTNSSVVHPNIRSTTSKLLSNRSAAQERKGLKSTPNVFRSDEQKDEEHDLTFT